MNNCPSYPDDIQQQVDSLKQWIVGIIRPTLGILGVLGNILVPMIILRKDLRNTFNKLLVCVKYSIVEIFRVSVLDMKS